MLHYRGIGVTKVSLAKVTFSVTQGLGQFKRLLKTHLFGVWDRGAL